VSTDIETAEITYGRLLESVHISGYTMERACIGLELLLDDDRWKTVGKGFAEIDDFLATIDLSQFRIAVDRRKKLAKQLADMQATQRATAKAIGVSVSTINQDINPVQNRTKEIPKPLSSNELEIEDVQNRTKDRPNPLAVTGAQVAQTLEKKVTNGDFHVSTGEVEWYTPTDVLDGVRSVMGSIDCDPASSEMAQKTVQAETYYTAEENGLEQPWTGNVFLNPPFASPQVQEFVARSVKAIEDKECNQITILTNNATDTDWFQSLCKACEVVCFTDGRVRFYNNEGETLQARQGQAIFYWGPNRQQFIDTFRSAGVIFAEVV